MRISNIITESENQMVLYHGGHKDLAMTFRDMAGNKKGSFEHGTGLYLTPSESMAAKYAKGGNAMFRVTVELERPMEDVTVTEEEVDDYITTFVPTKLRKEFREYALRRAKDGTIRIQTLMNLTVNYEIPASRTAKIRQWFVDHGVGYDVVTNYGGWGVDKGTVYIIYDPKLIKKVERKNASR